MSVGSAIAEFWAERSGRERAILLGALALALVLALYLFLWEPGLAARKSLAVTLPRLRAQLEDMRRQRAEIAALRQKLGAAPRRGDLAELVRASLARAPFAKSGLHVDALPNGGALLRGEDVIFDAWLDWVANLQRELGVRLDACTISTANQPGRVQVQARFMAGGSAR
jgi:type II secretory pathway component PulM